MFDVSADNSFRVMLVLIFIAALLLMEGLYFLWKAHRGPQARTLSRRMQALAGKNVERPKVQLLKGKASSAIPAMERWLNAAPKLQGLGRFVLQADVQWSAARLGLTSILLGMTAYFIVATLAFQGVFVGMAVGLAMAALPWVWLVWRRSRRLARVQRQLPDALDFITRSLRSGVAFTSALAMAGEELPEPIAAEFRTAHDEITFGVSLQQALTNMSERLPITDIRYFVVSVLIQRESGGNLTEVLGNLSRLIRERYKLLSKIRILSADGRFSAAILVLAPFALGALMNFGNPEFMAPLWTDPIGVGILKTLLILMLVGIFILSKIVKIRV